MMLPADIRRLQSLVALLGSPADGEVVASARGIARLLGRHGATVHDLTDAVGSAFAGVEIPDDAHWHDLAQWLGAHLDALTVKERGFVLNMVARDRGDTPSPAQLEWLEGLEQRVSVQTQAAA